MQFDSNGHAVEFERYRATLQLLARLDLDPRLRGSLDLSGVVQQTMHDAYRSFCEFRGQGETALLSWLKQILARNLLDEIRKLKRAKFDATRNRSLDELSSQAEGWLASDQTSPSNVACQNEQLIRLAQALDRLTEDQQTAVVRHHLQGVSLAEVACEMGRSKEAVAGLLHRGLTKLRDLLVDLERN
jgi:RNA polymerase sigma-70 factor (ECF subfamily)